MRTSQLLAVHRSAVTTPIVAYTLCLFAQKIYYIMFLITCVSVACYELCPSYYTTLRWLFVVWCVSNDLSPPEWLDVYFNSYCSRLFAVLLDLLVRIQLKAICITLGKIWRTNNIFKASKKSKLLLIHQKNSSSWQEQKNSIHARNICRNDKQSGNQLQKTVLDSNP